MLSPELHKQVVDELTREEYEENVLHAFADLCNDIAEARLAEATSDLLVLGRVARGLAQ